MKALHKPQELVEKIILETRPRPWVALSIGGCGILTGALVWRDGYGGGHDENYMGARSFALEFAHSVVRAIGFSAAHHLTPQILVDMAAVLNDGSTHVALSCTTWQCFPEGVEICSVGTNSVLVFEEGAIREAITPHSIRELLRSQGKEVHGPKGMLPTRALDDGSHCRVDDVRGALVPLLSTTTIAVIEDRRLADDILQQRVPGNELSSFIESWTPPGKRIRTSVLISLE